jgi:uncharacterized protein
MLAHNVAALLKSPPGTTRDVEIEEENPNLGPDITINGSIRGKARFYRTQNSIVVRGDVEAPVEIECSRCLESFIVTIPAHFEEEYLPSVNIMTGAPLAAGDDEALQIDEHHVLDLSEIVRQYLLTNMPLHAVCRPDCKGICPTCGADLNQGPCACDAEPATGPFAALASLLKED